MQHSSVPRWWRWAAAAAQQNTKKCSANLPKFETHTLRSVNDVTEGSTQEAHMCASCVLPRKVDKMV